MNQELQHIVQLLHRTYEGGAWHGPSVKEAVANISAQQAFNRLPDTHSIIELVAHMTAWRKYVAKRLAGDHTYKVADELNFPQPENWPETLHRLEESQAELLAAVEAFPAGRLQQQIPDSKEGFTYYTLVHGIIHHDLYHAGQIMLIKKARAKQSF